MYSVCDIGGTKMRIASATKEGLQSDPVIYETPQNYEEIVAILKKTIAEQTASERLNGVVVGVAGSLNRDNSSIHNSPHIPALNGKALRDELSQSLQAPVFLENDTALVGLGEAVFGAGRASSIVAYITVSTGVGGVRIVNQDIDQNVYGFEPGHHILDLHADEQCSHCGMKGHWEAFIGGASLEKKYGEDLEANLHQEQKNDIARYAAYGIYNTLVFWSPDIVILGGGLVVHNSLEIDTVKVYLEQCNDIIPELPPIVKGELSDIGGLLGGVAYIKKRI